GVVLGQGEDGSRGGGDQFVELGFDLAAGLGIKLVGVFLVAAAQRKFARRRMRQIDDVGGLEVDLEPVDGTRELLGDVVAMAGARGPGRKCREQRERGGKQARSAKLSS